MICFLSGRNGGSVVGESVLSQSNNRRASVLSQFGKRTMLTRNSNAKNIQVSLRRIMQTAESLLRKDPLRYSAKIPSKEKHGALCLGKDKQVQKTG